MVATTDNQLYAFGANKYANELTYHSNGQLGDDTIRDSFLPVPVDTTGALSDVIPSELGCGTGHSVVLSADGKVYTWGLNQNGQCGDGTNTNRRSAKWLSTLPTITQISVWEARTIALASNGQLYAFGFGGNGGIGDGTFNDRNTPRLVDLVNLNGESIVQVSSGFHTLLRTGSGNVYGFGANTFGALADGSLIPRTRPILSFDRLSIGKDVLRVSTQSFSSIFLTTDGTVYAAGLNLNGELGDGSVAFRLSPTLSKLPIVSEIYSGGGFTLAVVKSPISCFGVQHSDPLVCSAHGSCIYTDVCSCKPGYFGNNCQTSHQCSGINNTNIAICSGNGVCTSSEICTCNSGYDGDRCQRFALCNGIASNSSSVCSGRGTCVSDEKCKCASRQFEGKYCNAPICVDKIVSWWKGEGNANDFMKRNDLTSQNVAYTTGMVGKGFSIIPETVGSLSIRPVSLANFPTSQFSLVFWLRVNQTYNLEPNPTVVSYWTPGNVNSFSLVNTNDFTLILNGFSSRINISIADSQWHHVAVTWSSTGSSKTYLDGHITYDGVSSNTDLIDSGSLVFGQKQTCFGCFSNTDNFIGDLDEIMFLKRSLSASEISIMSTANIVCCGKSASDPTVCSGNGQCVSPDVCKCKNGYSGSQCDIENVCFGRTPTDPLQCNGNGNCTNTDTCVCSLGWQGSQCNETLTCFGQAFTHPNVCSRRGTCQGPDICQCNAGFSGPRCTYETFSYNMSCTTSGCNSTRVISGYSGLGKQISSLLIDFNVEKTDYVNANAFVEYLQINGSTIKSRCDIGSRGPCDSFYPCVVQYNATNMIKERSFLAQAKISNGVTQNSCNGKQFNAILTVHVEQSITNCFGFPGSDPSSCSGNGECIATDTCKCNWYANGPQCALINTCYGFNAIQPEVCSRRGRCVGTNKCECFAGFFGDQCETVSCFGRRRDQADVCNGNGQCVAFDVCQCKPGFQGRACETPVVIPFNQTIQLSCKTPGCIATSVIKDYLPSSSWKVTNMFLSIILEQSDFTQPEKAIEWIQINNINVGGGCYSSVRSCGGYFPCLTNLNASSIPLVINDAFTVALKISDKVTQSCNGNLLNANVSVTFEIALKDPYTPLSTDAIVGIVFASVFGGFLLYFIIPTLLFWAIYIGYAILTT